MKRLHESSVASRWCSAHAARDGAEVPAIADSSRGPQTSTMYSTDHDRRDRGQLTTKKPRVTAPSHVPHAFELTIVEGPDAGIVVRIDGAEPARLLVGQSPACKLRLSDPAVSRRHGALDVVANGLRFVDLDSTNGTTVNGVAVHDVTLFGGEVVRFGNTAIAVRRRGPRFVDLPTETSFGRVLGASDAMRKLHPILRRIAALEVPVLIEGEAGTGKALVAEELHAASGRAERPFVVFSASMSASLPSVLDEANGGTLLVAELADLDGAAHETLLAATRRDVRIIATTRRDLDRAVTEGRFSVELLARLCAARIELPPLRGREGDVALLARHFWHELGADGSLPDDFLARHADETWPANVRDLRNAVLERIVHGADEHAADGDARADVFAAILERDLPYTRAREQTLLEFQRRYVARALAIHGGNVAKAARASGLAHRYFQIIKAGRR
jgi:two-component system, NtrC family, response regulator HydG